MPKLLNRLALLATLSLACLHAAAQSYPSKPVKIIVPYSVGGIVDIITRIAAEKVASGWPQPIVIEARPGGNGYIGAELARNAKPDGYTLMTAAPFVVVAPLMDKAARFKTSDFAPVAMIGSPPNIFVAAPNLPVNTLKEFVEYARARPGELNQPMMGVGGSNHLGMEVFLQQNGLDIAAINYGGVPPTIIDLTAGRLSFSLTTMTALPAIQAGKLKPLAVNANTRISSLPNVPTMVEAGFGPDSIVMPWYGIVAPAGTPAAIVDKLNADFNKALADPEVQARYKAMHALLSPGTPADFAKRMADEQVRWGKLIKERNLKVN